MIRFCNSDMSHSMETYWVDYDGQLVVRRVLGPGESYLESSWATHPWVIRDRTTDEALLVVVGSDAAIMDQFYSAVWNSGALVLRCLALVHVLHADRAMMMMSCFASGQPTSVAGCHSWCGKA